jgi:hypothetical protein
MADDIYILTKLDMTDLSKDAQRALGSTVFKFEPYENDIQFDMVKKVRMASGVDKLIQSVMRIILTNKGEYIEDGGWGADMQAQIGGKVDHNRFATLRQNIIDALIHYNEVNSDNPNSDEVINTIDDLRVVSGLIDKDIVPGFNDPRALRIYLAFTTESGKGVRVTVPQVTE